jgi:hypothetical protein
VAGCGAQDAQELILGGARRHRPACPDAAARWAARVAAARLALLISYIGPLVPRSIEASGWAGDVALDRLPTGSGAQGNLPVRLGVLVDMRGNSSGTTDANASTEQAASCAIAVQAFQVGKRWRHGFTVAAVPTLTRRLSYHSPNGGYGILDRDCRVSLP